MNIDLIYFINTEPHEATKYIKNIAFSYWIYFLIIYLFIRMKSGTLYGQMEYSLNMFCIPFNISQNNRIFIDCLWSLFNVFSLAV